MNENNVLMSQWEWDGIVNDPRHQAEADARAACQAKQQEGRNEIFRDFYQKSAVRRKERTMITALRFLIGTVGASIIAYLAGSAGIAWLVWIFGVTAVVLCLFAVYGFGKYRGMDK